MNNPYQVLGLPNHASFDDVRKKYLNLVKIHHPDNGGNQKDFESITSAYSVIESKNGVKKNNTDYSKTYTSKKNDFVKDIKVSIPIKNFLLGPTVEIILGSDSKNKPVKINVSNCIRKITTEVNWDKIKKNISVKITPKSSNIYKVIEFR